MTASPLPNPLQRTLERLGLGARDFDKMPGALGTTPKETIHAQGTLKLHHYRPRCDSLYRVPLLIVTSIVNQPTILDLVPGQSMVEYLLDAGFDVYMVEWGRPRREHHDLQLEDLVLDRLPRCVDRVLEHSGEKELSLIGYCLGGFLSVLYASLHPKAPIRNFIAMAAPVDSDGLVALKAWMGPDFDEDALLEHYGNVPADWVQNALRALRPFGKMAGAASLLNNVDNDEAVKSSLRMGKWETDNIPFPGGVFKQLVRDFLRGNLLMKGKLVVGGQRVNVKNIKAPFLNLLAQEDHITPYASSHPLMTMVGSKLKEELVIKGGHVGLVAGRGALTRMWPALSAWLAAKSV
jgi:polyhydroxyalkanoate synthase subunit PhaC